MNYIDGFREPRAARVLTGQIHELADVLRREGRQAAIMEVCGTHTMAISRYGIRSLLPSNVDLISGPGCPVCVTPAGYVDAAVDLASRGVIVVTFGDLIHVPGSRTSLAHARADGASVEVAYGPARALELARRHPERDVVFLAVGFETTTAPLAGLADSAMRAGIRNLSLLTAFKCVPPALRALRSDPAMKIDAFLCPAHVSAIIGSEAYRPFADGPDGVPCVVAGFEPLDILLGLKGILEQLAAGISRVDNEYSRVVKPGGNPRALSLMSRLLQPVDAEWRGLGSVPQSGLGFRPEFSAWDASLRHDLHIGPGREAPGCRCGDVVKGKLKPPGCPLFGNACTPDTPVGPCMVSSEGTCSAYFKYAAL